VRYHLADVIVGRLTPGLHSARTIPFEIQGALIPSGIRQRSGLFRPVESIERTPRSGLRTGHKVRQDNEAPDGCRSAVDILLRLLYGRRLSFADKRYEGMTEPTDRRVTR
jgi:hypothetical protein